MSVAFLIWKECDVKRDTCQDSTDFTKCVRELFRQRATGKIKFDTILVLCSTDGRLDHILAIVQTLYLTHRMEPDTAIVLVCSNSLSFLMQPVSPQLATIQLMQLQMN
eukprot:m.90391 g.90391  ORF g.90391 m.90391 type:complete len:108 (+) comp36644_c0_seq18:294-617(+)